MAEKLATTTEPENPHDKHAVKVLKDKEVVDHIPNDLSKCSESALLCGGTVEIHGYRKKRKQIYCNGPKYMLTNVECMIKDCLGRTDFQSIYYISNNFL